MVMVALAVSVIPSMPVDGGVFVTADSGVVTTVVLAAEVTVGAEKEDMAGMPVWATV